MNTPRRRLLHRLVAGLLLLLLIVALARWGQLYLDSRLQGARGPYLQMPAPDAITVRWQTLEARRGEVRYGAASDKLDAMVAGAVSRVHELRLTGLKPDSRYFYSVNGEVHSFHTAPLPGAERPVRLWVQGDPGRAIPSTMQGRDAVLQWVGDHPRPGLPPVDLWLTTGDNAYRSGKDDEFQQHLFSAYPRLLPTVPYLPAHGNHDARRATFFKLFSFPTAGEGGGIPSGSEHYFSLDYGPVHLLFLDSHDGDLGRDGAMLGWLQQDLAATRQPWIIALLHHPPYSKGSHDSDDELDSGGRMHAVRENVLPLLEQGGVDLALFGHSHVYERSHLMACHYGDSATFTPRYVLQHSESGEYRKATTRQALGGTLYNVVGSSAYAEKGPLDHPAMAVALRETGSLLLDVNGPLLEARFIAADGRQLDHYRIHKVEGVSAGTASCGTP